MRFRKTVGVAGMLSVEGSVTRGDAEAALAAMGLSRDKPEGIVDVVVEATVAKLADPSSDAAVYLEKLGDL